MFEDPSRRLDFRDTVGAFATGVTVVTSRVGDTHAGMTLNSFTSRSRTARARSRWWAGATASR